VKCERKTIPGRHRCFAKSQVQGNSEINTTQQNMPLRGHHNRVATTVTAANNIKSNIMYAVYSRNVFSSPGSSPNVVFHRSFTFGKFFPRDHMTGNSLRYVTRGKPAELSRVGAKSMHSVNQSDNFEASLRASKDQIIQLITSL